VLRTQQFCELRKLCGVTRQSSNSVVMVLVSVVCMLKRPDSRREYLVVFSLQNQDSSFLRQLILINKYWAEHNSVYHNCFLVWMQPIVQIVDCDTELAKMLNKCIFCRMIKIYFLPFHSLVYQQLYTPPP